MASKKNNYKLNSNLICKQKTKLTNSMKDATENCTAVIETQNRMGMTSITQC